MSTSPIVLGRVYVANVPNVRKLTDDECARFVMRWLAANRSIVSEFTRRVDHAMGAPRQLTVEGLIVAGIVAGLSGNLHVKGIAETARVLHPSIRYDLGLTKLDDGLRRTVTDRMVAYLFGQMAQAFAPTTPLTTIPLGDDFVDLATGEIVAGEPEPDVTIELIGNRLIASLWEYLGLPQSPEWALDSAVIETHYGVRAYGGINDIDPVEVADSDRARASGTSADAAAYREQWDATDHPERESSSRSPEPIGPTAEGSFTRVDPNFPQIGPDGRLRHTLDAGAANAYRGGGRHRSSQFVTGRDKHALVGSGFMPNGFPFPPLLRAYTCTLGGASRREAGRQAFIYANATGIDETNRHASLDRIYTNVEAETFEHPVADLGWTLTKSLSVHQQTVTPWAPGTLLVDGYWYSNALPENMRELPARPMNASSEHLAELQKRYDKRIPYAMVAHGTQTATGNLRLRGPAVPKRVIKDSRGNPTRVVGMKVACPNSPYYNIAPTALPITTCTPDEPCGCSKTITIRRSEIPSSYEPTLWGSTRWAHRYARRNLVETFNSTESYHYRFTRHSIRVQANKWDFAHLLLTISVWIQHFRKWSLRQGAHAIDVEEYPDGPLDPEVVAVVMERISTPEGSATPRGAPPD